MMEPKERSWIKRIVWRIETARRITQIICFLFFNALLFGVGPWPLLLPVLYSQDAYYASIGDSFGVLQWILYDPNPDLLIHIVPWLPIAAFLITAVFLGRALCGWVCPFGLVQDLLGDLKKKPTKVSRNTHKSLLPLKYAVLAITLFISGLLAVSLAMGGDNSFRIALGEDFAKAPFNALSPGETLFATMPRIVSDLINTNPEVLLSNILVIQPFLWIRIAILVLILVLAVNIPRSWCRYLCPHGALLAILTRFSFLGLKRDPVKCTKTGCRACVEVCPMKVRLLEFSRAKHTDSECIYCLKCVESCPSGALRPRFP